MNGRLQEQCFNVMYYSYQNLCHTNSIPPKLINPFSIKKIPLINLLHHWKNQISAAKSILVHNVQRTRLSIDQELGWLCQPYMKSIVQNLPSVSFFKAYKSIIIINWPQGAFVDDLEISSQDLWCYLLYDGGNPFPEPNYVSASFHAIRRRRVQKNQ